MNVVLLANNIRHDSSSVRNLEIDVDLQREAGWGTKAMISSCFQSTDRPTSPSEAQLKFIGTCRCIVSSLERAGDIHWLPLRLFTGDLVTVKHAFAIPL